MRSAVLALAAATLVGACSNVNGPTSPTPARAIEAGESAAAKAFPDQDTGGLLLTATMTGPAEAPVPGDPDGSGSARFTFNPGQEEVCYVLEVTGIDTPTAAHIHVAPAGSPGPIVVPLAAPVSGTSSGCVSAGRELITSIIQDPGAYYVNVHNAAFRGGAVRGQLSK